MIGLARFFSVLGLTLAAIPIAGWLLLVCADFLSLTDCLSPQAGWTAFALICSLSMVLPAALHVWPDHARSLPDILRETARAVLFSFSLFALFFLLFGRPLLDWLHLPKLMLPTAALALAPLFSCPLLYVSYKIASLLLPRPGPDAPAPRPVRLFGTCALAIVLMLLLLPFLRPAVGGTPVLYTSGLNMLCESWRFFALRYVIASCGNAGFVPAWGGCCLVSVLEMIRALPSAVGADLFIMAALFALMLAGSVCLLLPSSRRWLC